jgi:protein-tyrosine phosphatase
LVETPYGPLPSIFEDALFELTARGFRILLAHPERSRTFQQSPERLAELVGRGTLVQVTAESLVRSPRRSRSGRFARRLVKDGLAHVLASDSHGSIGLMRAPISAAIDAVRELGDERGAWMTSLAPAAILSGESLPPAPGAAQTERQAGVDRLRR